MVTNGRCTILVCQGTGCVSARSPEVQEALESGIKASGLGDQVEVKLSGCHGFCEQGPLLALEPEGFLYTHVKRDDVPEIVSDHLENGKPVERLFYRDPLTKEPIPYYRDIAFYSRQTRFLLRNCGHINPEKIEDYIALGGYQALRKALAEMTSDQVLEEVSRSGLRGRGGAGFPTGRKWAFCRQAHGEPKYVICNADEGDPGAYMDRSILETDPHGVIEGMVIGAYAIGASSGVIFVRAEYPLAVNRVRTALSQAQEHGFLGENILGSGFDFSIDIECGSGAFVSGEETALIASIEGLSGEPRERPPFPAQRGLWGKPTNINNVKTWASVPLIVSRGADWYSQIGTEQSKGTMVFSLVGKVRNSGLVEVPMGTSLHSLVFDIGGGIPEDRGFKAVQTGGPSGGCIPADLADMPVDYERLTEAGSIMGSGGLVVLDEDTCMVDVAKYFISFTVEESCGKCVPCREGVRRMHEILTDITEGRGREEDIELLEEMGNTIIDSSLCGLGGSAPNPVLTTIRYFADEYRAHILEKRCPAFACKALTSYYIDPSKCQACLICSRECPAEAVIGARDQIHIIDQEKCTKCGTCYDVCPKRFSAVIRLSGVPVPEPIPEDERVVVRARRAG
ncbi:MAG: NADH-quinone oxidoreductase subunit NuoF [Chloroflexota bacterium]